MVFGYPDASFDVYVNASLNLLDAVAHEGVTGHDASVVDEDVNMRDCLKCFFSCPLHLLVLGHVAAEGVGLTSCFQDQRGCLTGSPEVDVPAQDSAAVLGPKHGQLPADAPAGTCDLESRFRTAL